MIGFHDAWLPQIIRYCELISDLRILRRAWVTEREIIITSATDFDELYEQIFDDLDSDLFQTEIAKHLPDNTELGAAIIEFLEAIRNTDSQRSCDQTLMDAQTLLDSASWARTRNAAATVLRQVESRPSV